MTPLEYTAENGAVPGTAGPEEALAQLLDDTRALVRRYVVLSDEQLDAVALWIAHTHAVEGAHQTPYLDVSSAEKQCGKSRLLEVLELVSARAVQWTQPSAAVVYRTIAAVMPTVLLDEVDAIWNEKGEENEALRALVNSGHRRGATVPRCVGVGTSMTVTEFPVFCPKVLAGIGRLPDTIADRSIPVKMKRKTRDEPVERFRRRRAEPIAEPLKERLEAWGQGSIESLLDADPEMPEELSDRQMDGCEPLLAIADMAGERWSMQARMSLIALLTDEANAPEESLRLRCLSDCREALAEIEHGAVPSHWLVERLHTIEGSPWKERDLTQNTLAWFLKDYGIRPKKIRFQVGAESKSLQGYTLDKFEDAWKRLLPTREKTPARG
jgi:hypothetical protein